MFRPKSHKIDMAVEYVTVQAEVVNPAYCYLQVMSPMCFECSDTVKGCNSPN